MNLEAKLKHWKKKKMRGEIVRHAEKMTEQIHTQTQMIRRAKKGMEDATRIHTLQIEAELERIHDLQGTQQKGKEDYNLCMKYLKKAPHFTKPRPPVVAPRIIPIPNVVIPSEPDPKPLQKALAEIKEEEEEEPEYECPICHRIYASASTLKGHITKKHKEI